MSQADVERQAVPLGGAEPDEPAPEFTDDLDYNRRRRQVLIWTLGTAAALVAVVTLGVALGPVPIPPDVVWSVIGHHTVGVPAEVTWTTTQDNIVWLVRTPRVLLGLAVGAGLSICGVAIQALVRNVLADPYLLGVSSGASFGASLSILFGVGSALGANALAGSAFVGGLAAIGLVFALARLGGPATAIRLILAGVAVGYTLSALTSFTIFASDAREGARAVLFWLLGGLDQARWSSVAVPMLTVVVVLLVLIALSRSLDAIAAGDETARTLGTDPTRVRTNTLVLVALCIGVMVAVSGTIGFVGLVVPHLARRLVGGVHRRLLPVAALSGAALLVGADILARVAFAPRELPIGVVTSLVGAPFIVLLLRRTAPKTPTNP
ncbi:MAG: FecCD family ABC transporter permease [Acidimicrobiales bacterium]